MRVHGSTARPGLQSKLAPTRLSAALIDNEIVTFTCAPVGFYVRLHLRNPVPIRFAQPYRRIAETRISGRGGGPNQPFLVLDHGSWGEAESALAGSAELIS